MRFKGSSKNLKAKDKNSDKPCASERPPAEQESLHWKVLSINRTRQAWRLVDSAVNVHFCNHKRLMANYVKRPMQIGASILEEISLGQGKVRLRLAVLKESEREWVTFILNNIYYLPNSPSNLVSLAPLNDKKIYLNNKNEIFYNSNTKKNLALT